MDRDRMIEIFEGERTSKGLLEDNSEYKGLYIIAKYTNNCICGAAHDIIYSESIDNLIEAGITEEDCITLNDLGWMVEDNDYLAIFV